MTRLINTHHEESKSSRFPNNLPPTWREKLKNECEKAYFKKLTTFLSSEFSSKQTIYPEKNKILRALQLLDLPQVKVVILGQDPYHGNNQATGLCFAVPNDLRIKPPSLINIFKEISENFSISVNKQQSELLSWVKQGVLLLNTVLTVRAGLPLSHRQKGWETFTDEVIRILNERKEPVIFLLWGSSAQQKAAMIDKQRHFILKAPHPSPLSAHRGFLGCGHFKSANDILTNRLGETPIDWAKTE
jgi:uracil-DNA glycosylase